MKYLAPILLFLLASVIICVHSRRTQGFIDVEAQLAHFKNLRAKAYMAICVIESGIDPGLPIGNYQICTEQCTSRLTSYTDHPTWHQSCLPNPHGHPMFNTTRVVVEIYSKNGKDLSVKQQKQKQFLGGNSITVPDLLRSGLNGNPWQFTLYSGRAQGYGVARINWTPVKV